MVMSVEPQVIPRKKHRVSRKHVSRNALHTLYRLHSNGFIAHLVGGCVRDLLLGRTPKDFDIGTNARPGQIKRLFRNCRLIGRRFRLAHIHFPNEIIEVSTFRRDAPPPEAETPTEETERPNRRPWHLKNEDGMVLLDNVFGTAEEDAIRRDFTVNALSYNIADCSVIDYTTGLADLQECLIRPIGDPRVRFTEDPLRMLRAVRFAATLGFEIEPAAWEAICELSPTISRIPARLYEEFKKLFLLGSARPAFTLLEKSGLLAALFPSLTRWMYGKSRRIALVETNLDAFDRLARSGGAPSLALFMAALFGPLLEEAALARHIDGIPYAQALDEASAQVTEEVFRPLYIPGRIIARLRGILGLQPSLHRMPRRRPASVIARQEFPEALDYLRFTAETRSEYQATVEWWERFLLQNPLPEPSETPDEEKPRDKRRRRRRRRHGKPRESQDA